MSSASISAIPDDFEVPELIAKENLFPLCEPDDSDPPPKWEPIPERITRGDFEEIQKQCHDASMILSRTVDGNAYVKSSITHFEGMFSDDDTWTCVELHPQFDVFDKYALDKTAYIEIGNGKPIDVIGALVEMFRNEAATWLRAARALEIGRPIKAKIGGEE